ncbi:MAG: hypothetical protein HYV13_02330 [Candidatus Doudnabacteria bacterium]|nr:hypothetical protein [Candidatus Doudnabacteria bacterium]
MQQADFIRIVDRLNQASNILILTPHTASADDLAASLALRGFLTKLDKETTLVSPGALSEKYNFLPQFEQVRTDLQVSKNFIIDVSTKRVAIDELSYKKEEDKLSIFIKPKNDQFTKDDVSVRTSDLPFDLVILIGVSSLDSLGEFYSKNTELFFEAPVVNIDYKSTNENYGQFNLVDLSATSNSEIIFDLINSYESSMLDAEIATSLLTGIIAETNSFQHSRTTPSTFLKASQLVSLGANQREIIGRLFKTKTLSFLKLWGRVLARLKQEPAMSLVYSVANASDIQKSGAAAEDVRQIIKEMSFQLSFAKIFLFLAETSNHHIEVFAFSTVPLNLSQVFASFKPEVIGSVVRFEVNADLNQAEIEVLNKLKETVL